MLCFTTRIKKIITLKHMRCIIDKIPRFIFIMNIYLINTWYFIIKEECNVVRLIYVVTALRWIFFDNLLLTAALSALGNVFGKYAILLPGCFTHIARSKNISFFWCNEQLQFFIGFQMFILLFLHWSMEIVRGWV